MVNFTPIYDENIIRELTSMSDALLPIEQSSTWKGRIIGFSESVRRQFNQFINRFKTGAWSMEQQAAVKLKKDLHKITTMVNKETLNKASEPSTLKVDFTMRTGLDNRLKLMYEIFKIAEKKQIEKGGQPAKIFQDLKKEFTQALDTNKSILEWEAVQIKKDTDHTSRAKGVFAEAAEKGRQKILKGQRGPVVGKEIKAAELVTTEMEDKRIKAKREEVKAKREEEKEEASWKAFGERIDAAMKKEPKNKAKRK